VPVNTVGEFAIILASLLQKVLGDTAEASITRTTTPMSAKPFLGIWRAQQLLKLQVCLQKAPSGPALHLHPEQHAPSCLLKLPLKAAYSDRVVVPRETLV
jgi:hypothetical protein